MEKNIKKRKSSLFTNLELEILLSRVKGDYSDKTGLFSKRVRPKIMEILYWSEPKQKKILKKAFKQLRDRSEDNN